MATGIRWRGVPEKENTLNTGNGFLSHHKPEKYDRLGECSPEKDCGDID